MTFFDHLSIPPALGPLALMSATILATVLLARPRRPRANAPTFMQRRLGPPTGVQKAVIREAPAALANSEPLAAQPQPTRT